MTATIAKEAPDPAFGSSDLVNDTSADGRPAWGFGNEALCLAMTHACSRLAGTITVDFGGLTTLASLQQTSGTDVAHVTGSTETIALDVGHVPVPAAAGDGPGRPRLVQSA